MSILDSYRRKKRAQEAANQMYKLLAQGISFEVPASLSTDDPTTQAVMLLRKQHPDVVGTMLQSRVVVLTRVKNFSAQPGEGFKGSAEAWGLLKGADYLPDTQTKPEDFIDQHIAFMNRAGVIPEAAVKRANEEVQAHNAIILPSVAPPVPPLEPVSPETTVPVPETAPETKE